MKKYSDYQEDKNSIDLTKEEISKIDWTRYKIIVPTEEDRKELLDAFKHFHDSGFDSELITANQLAHEYLDGSNILVAEKLFNLIDKK